MDAVFYFSFYIDDNCDDDDEPTTRTLGFYVSNIRKPWGELEEDLADVASELELEYGVHDWGTFPSGVNAIGYNSGEVEEERCNELMELWRQAFVEHAPHCVVSAVVELSNVEDLTDADILEFTKNAHEQQQAERQRNTLNTHIRGSGSVAPSKKI